MFHSDGGHFIYFEIIFTFKNHNDFSKIEETLWDTYLEDVSGALPVPAWLLQKLQMVMDAPSQSSQIQNEWWWC